MTHPYPKPGTLWHRTDGGRMVYVYHSTPHGYVHTIPVRRGDGCRTVRTPTGLIVTLPEGVMHDTDGRASSIRASRWHEVMFAAEARGGKE